MKNKNKKTEITNVWKNKFDMIFCLNYASNGNRRDKSYSEFRRVGILPNDNFNWVFNFKSPYEHIVYDVAKNMKLNDCTSIEEFNCMFGHYRIIKTAIEIGCERILILEDDNHMLNDIDYVVSSIENTPEDYDIVLYSYMLIGDMVNKFHDGASDNRVNDYFCRYGIDDIWGAGFYSLSRRGMVEIAEQMERHARPADMYTTRQTFSKELKKCCSIRNLSIQYEDSFSMHRDLESFYKKMGCNIDEYSKT